MKSGYDEKDLLDCLRKIYSLAISDDVDPYHACDRIAKLIEDLNRDKLFKSARIYKKAPKDVADAIKNGEYVSEEEALGDKWKDLPFDEKDP